MNGSWILLLKSILVNFVNEIFWANKSKQIAMIWNHGQRAQARKITKCNAHEMITQVIFQHTPVLMEWSKIQKSGTQAQ